MDGMTIQECYQRMGGDYNEVVTRLLNERLVARFVCRFPEDRSYEQLVTCMKEGDREGAFRAAHTLKGVCQNLGLGQLKVSVELLTELLRPATEGISGHAAEVFQMVQENYRSTLNTINAFRASENG